MRKPLTLLTTIVCFLFFIAPPLQAQEYSYVNYNIREGLTGSVVYCMAQDHDGFIWFGTETGLSRFDGTRFKNFTTLDGLPDNEIIGLYVDSENRVWITPFGNELCYYSDGKLHTRKNDTLLQRLSTSGQVIGVVENDRHEIAIVTGHGVNLLKPDGQILAVKNPAPQHAVRQYGLDFDGSILISIPTRPSRLSELYRVVNDSLVFVLEKSGDFVSPAAGAYLSKNVRIFYEHPSRLRFETPNSDYTLPIASGFLNLGMINDSIVSVTSSEYTELVNFRQRKIVGRFLVHEKTSSMLEDREGNLWFATLGKGVFRLASMDFKVARLVMNNNYQPVYALAKSGDSLYAGSDDFALWTLNLKDESISSKRILSSVSQGRITVLEIAGKSEMLAGTDVGLARILQTAIVQTPWFAVKSFYKTNDTVWVGHNTYAEFYDLKTLRKLGNVYPGRSTAILSTHDSVFVGTLHGLYLKVGNREPEFIGNMHKAAAERISSIKKTSDGTIWIGTYGAGLVAYRNGRFDITLSQDSGLSSNIVRTIFVSGNILWVGTDKGLNKVNWVNGNHFITRYSSSDGLVSDIVNAVYVDSTGVYVGTPEGLCWFREENIFTRSMCNLKLTDIRSEKRSSVTDSSAVIFDHFDKDIRFEFIGISFKSAGEIIYRYKLNGLDDRWRSTRENFLHYPTLPSGNYVLELQAVNKFGVESYLIRLPFTIQALIWEKTWFQILSVIFLGALIWIFIVFRINKFRKLENIKSETNRKMAELEQMALKAQMNPHFIFNSLNSIQHYMFEKDVQGANRFITEFSKLMRLTLDLSSKTGVSLDDEIAFLTTYLELEMKRFENKFNYLIEVGDNVDPLHMFVPPMLLQPYVENSIRHGVRYRSDNDGLITIRFFTQDDYLLCSIEDNGIGRERSKQLKGTTNIEYQSKGMTLASRRIEMMNKSFTFPIYIRVEDLYSEKEGTGTRVEIKIPVSEMTRIVNKPLKP